MTSNPFQNGACIATRTVSQFQVACIPFEFFAWHGSAQGELGPRFGRVGRAANVASFENVIVKGEGIKNH
jgi:hypothetical protein